MTYDKLLDPRHREPKLTETFGHCAWKWHCRPPAPYRMFRLIWCTIDRGRNPFTYVVRSWKYTDEPRAQCFPVNAPVITVFDALARGHPFLFYREAEIHDLR